MPLVASNGGGEAGRPSRFRNGSDHLFVAALAVSGMRRAGIDLFLQRGRSLSSCPPRPRGDSPRGWPPPVSLPTSTGSRLT